MNKWKEIQKDLGNWLVVNTNTIVSNITCDHKFTKMRNGYYCKECGLRTGSNTKWNEIIESVIIAERKKEGEE